jgi:hypothetical protein
MAYSTYSSYRTTKPHAYVFAGKNSITTTGAMLGDRWAFNPNLGANTAGALDASTTGALSGTPTGIATWIKTYIGSHAAGGTVIIYDRLVQSSGHSGIVTTAQTVNTAALTRYTSGVGVFMGVCIFSTVGTTATTFTVSYTNSSGTSGRTSPACTIGGTNDRNTARFICIPLQVGDVGVQSVQSVTLAATTGTAGNFGIVLWRPLLAVSSPDINSSPHLDMVRHLACFFDKVQQDACLATIFGAQTTATWLNSSTIELIKAV